MKQKWLLISGGLAAVVYVMTVILGGALRPGYDHLAEPISELTASGAPNKSLLDVLFIVYNLLVMSFGAGLFQRARGDARGQRSGMLAGVALIVTGICGVLLQLFFPQDMGGARAPVTTTGTMHVAVAGIAALTSMLAALSSALSFRKQPELKAYVPYSLVTLVVMFISGGLGAAGASGGGFALFGLVERITIGSFVLWLLMLSLKLYTLMPAAGRIFWKAERRPAGNISQ